MVKQVDALLIESGRVSKGDPVVIIAGAPPGIPGSTNALRVHIVGDAIDGVHPAYQELISRRYSYVERLGMMCTSWSEDARL